MMHAKDLDGLEPKVVLSFGIGRLHFVQASEALIQNGADLIVLQGWVPGRMLPPWALDRLGKLVGSPHLSVGMSRRSMPFLPRKRNVSLAWPEFLTQVFLQASGRFGLHRGYAARAGWRAFGRASAKQLSRRVADRDVFHVRSGAGFHAISAARAQGMRIVVDHSIAHPAFLERALRLECEAMRVPFWTAPSDPFWAQVLKDCLDADRLLVNSHFVKRTFVDEGMAPEKIEVIYLGVRDDFLALKQDYKIKNDRLELLYTGQFGARKGARYLVEGLEALQEAGINFHLTVLGDFSEGAPLLAQSPVADRVSLLGFVPQDQLREYLAQSDIYVFPSLAEGCASSAMEALAAGLPVVATEETGLPASHECEALIIPAAQGKAIASAIQRLANERDLRERLGRSAASMMAKKFTWDTYGSSVCSMYKRML